MPDECLDSNHRALCGTPEKGFAGLDALCVRPWHSHYSSLWRDIWWRMSVQALALESSLITQNSDGSWFVALRRHRSVILKVTAAIWA